MRTQRIVAFKRRQGSSIDEFRNGWAGAHADLVRELPGLVRYVQNATAESAYSRGREPMFDAIAEVQFEVGAAAALRGSPEIARLRQHEDLLVDRSTLVDLPVVPTVITDQSPGAAKLVMFIKRRADLTLDQFASHWAGVHASLSVKNPHLGRYVQWVVRPDVDESVAFDGVGMTWFDSMDKLRESGTDPAAAEGGADGANFLEGGQPEAAMLVNETIVCHGGDGVA